ncbi:hypothetical protein ONS96_000816 [Cadophora gregata f. sp. sojae]|nr:hypothetical protein ONS96_000816 [Cadophora gregata f. sp. sojae]
MLSFISQTGPKIQDPKLKKLVRQNARNHVSRQKGTHVDPKPLQFRLLVPDSFSFTPSSESQILLEEVNVGDQIPGADVIENGESEMEKWNSILNAGPSSAILTEPQEEDLSRNMSGQDAGTYGNPAGVRHLELSTRQQLGRTRKPKTKTGCLTCKTRHLKCDESKPSCLRCLKSTGTCTGYAKVPSTRIDHRAIIARPSVLIQQPTQKAFLNDEKESYFFKIFQSQTAADLSGVYKSTFWDHILIRESTHQNSVMSGIISIAALNESVKSAELARSATDSNKVAWQAEAKNQREYALEQYDKAIRGMRTITTDSNSYLRKMLISTLLVFVFETIHAQPDVAFWHAMIGDRMLCSWVTEQWANRNSRRRGIASPATSILEDEILLIFCRFDTQFLTFVETRGHQVHINGMRDGTPAVQEMPLVFSDLAEATTYWELVLRRSCHFIMYGAVRTKSRTLQKDTPSTLGGRTIEINAENSIYGSPFLVPDGFIQEQAEKMNDIDRWSASFHKLLANGKSASPGLREVANIALLRMTSLSIKVAVAGTTFTNETSYDEFLPQFTEIVSLARQVTDNLLVISNNKPAYHFHTSVVPPLFIVLLRCRDRAVRREAIEILRMQQHDGPWDRFMIASIGSWIMEIEEQGWDGVGTIPEGSRVQLSMVKIGLEDRSVMVQCVRRRVCDVGGGNQPQEPGLTWIETVIRAW